MTSRRIVLDANILIRAMLGVKVGGLLTKYAGSIDFCAPSIAFEDAEANLPGIMAKREIGPAELSIGLDAVRLLVDEIPGDVAATPTTGRSSPPRLRRSSVSDAAHRVRS